MTSNNREGSSHSHSSYPSVAESSLGSDQLMAEHSITYNGRQYLYGPYRYDRLSDAVNYARLQALRGASPPQGVSAAPFVVASPNPSELELMNTLGITFANGVFSFGEFRYGRLSDAVNYAQLRPQGIAT